jgi:hypothetical protein
MKRAKMKWILPLFLLAMSGCMSVQTNPAIGVPTFAPTNPDSIEILRMPPKQPNIRLGEITVEPPGENVDVPKVEEAFRKAAAKWGANAVVIVADRTQVVGLEATGAWYGREISPELARVIVGVAVRYTPATTPVGVLDAEGH